MGLLSTNPINFKKIFRLGMELATAHGELSAVDKRK